ncbi:MAG: tRNA (adenosine(37)-N6)-threonylcarbamoyltransferase complex dimerization subunit type 1 TsaB [Alteromonadaceae bacterium]|nr:tRNA (adenosine(37)-N6)-threonylcarbamoyltransferase complex dimerization subunit type 1 TsaB [Alteromonadaceae bacterium]
MNILVIDTATEACSVAVQKADDVVDQFEVCPQQHSKKILPMIDEVLVEAGLTFADVNVLGVAQGPGSFTGVRIAMGMIQGLSFAGQKPIVGLSTLQAMAQETYEDTGACRVISAIDARMSEVYVGEFRLDNNGIMALQGEQQVLPPEEVISQYLHSDEAFGYAGTGWIAYEPLAERISGTPLIHYPKARYMLPQAAKLIQDKAFTSADSIEPVYLRDKVTWKKLPGRE